MVPLEELSWLDGLTTAGVGHPGLVCFEPKKCLPCLLMMSKSLRPLYARGRLAEKSAYCDCPKLKGIDYSNIRENCLEVPNHVMVQDHCQ